MKQQNPHGENDNYNKRKHVKFVFEIYSSTILLSHL